ncbi:L,D-transpeptidase [Prochlorothrix hollandica]|uniref:L,D-TPase catalytic domain-containing protein n=1 Tax=Prochlorothrix hollandica PCC 9006 = CALU 1027 TaxID=317619 RepID=A0A0M2PY65_PROHO|nr:L,D-transpeptidase [Prochlorothrix hollandica]KKJ01371.1 hypothetical protein PROH_03200 [Prochlorothrix hollandica PCC 9006 = CALU 1027]
MPNASSLATQVMVLCFGASLLSLLPLHSVSRWITGQSIALARSEQTQPNTQPSTSNLIRIGDSPPPLGDAAAPPAVEADPPLAQPPRATVPELVVDLSDRRLYWQENGQVYKSYPIAVGQDGWETPVGVFHVLYTKKNPSWQHPIIRDKVVPPGPDNPLGAAWIGFFVDGKQHIGFHGTPNEDLLGQAVSHGCIRMRNQDILELYGAVEEGWVVRVRS